MCSSSTTESSSETGGKSITYLYKDDTKSNNKQRHILSRVTLFGQQLAVLPNGPQSKNFITVQSAVVRDASLSFGVIIPFGISLSLLDKNGGGIFMHANYTSDPSAR